MSSSLFRTKPKPCHGFAERSAVEGSFSWTMTSALFPHYVNIMSWLRGAKRSRRILFFAGFHPCLGFAERSAVEGSFRHEMTPVRPTRASSHAAARAHALGGPGIEPFPTLPSRKRKKQPTLKDRLFCFCSVTDSALRNYSLMPMTTPEPTVRPPSRIAKRRFFSMAMGVISSTSISTLSPGMHISTPSGREMTPVTSVVRK